MSACTFFGHRDCFGLDVDLLKKTIEDQILRGTDTFYVGHQGRFDWLVLGVLEQLKEEYPQICYSVVLAYLPVQKREHNPYTNCSIYPEGMETAPPRFAIDKRNRWMLDRSDRCVCFVNHTWGGAYKFACMAKRRNKTVINLGTVSLDDRSV